MSRFTTILWDTGGVLLTNGWDHNERATVFDALHLEDREGFNERHEAENDLWEKGRIDFEEYMQRTMFYRPQPFTPAQMRSSIEAQSILLEDTAMPVLQQLQAQGGLTLGQLNNESRELNDVRLKRFGLDRLFSVFFCSGYVGLRKPDTAIYRLALEVLQKPAAEVIFVDDRENNIHAARSLGIHGIHYVGCDALRKELNELGLLNAQGE